MTKRKKNINKSEETTVYFVDTSYLLEYFKVGNRIKKDYTEESFREIIKRIDTAIINGHTLFVPISCLYELGDHIGNLADDQKKTGFKQEIMGRLIEKCQETGSPFTITHDLENIEFRKWCEKLGYQPTQIFYTQYLWEKFQKCPKKGFSLVDTMIKEAAKSFQKKRSSHGLKYKIHILTRDKALKDTEPDAEDDPFVQKNYARGKSNCHE